jgi:hypothetical protein
MKTMRDKPPTLRDYPAVEGSSPPSASFESFLSHCLVKAPADRCLRARRHPLCLAVRLLSVRGCVWLHAYALVRWSLC